MQLSSGVGLANFIEGAFKPMIRWQRAFVGVMGVMLAAAELANAADDRDYCNGSLAIYEPPHDGWYFTWENDALGAIRSDQYYTQGAQVGYTFDNQSLPAFVTDANSWLCKLFNFSYRGEENDKVQSATTVFLGQQLFTAKDKSRTDPIPDDRPYAGWLYAGNRLDLVQGLKLSEDNRRRWKTHTLELQLGVVGPAALGKSTQQKFHDVLYDWFKSDTEVSQGWDNQLPNQFGAQLHYHFSTRLGSVAMLSGIGDAILNASAAVGNLQTYGEAGVTFRFGRNMGPLAQRAMVPSASNMSMQALPPDSGSASIDAQRQHAADATDTKECRMLRAEECYVFAGVNARAVGRNIFVDSAPSGAGTLIHREPFVYDLTAGVRVRYEKFRIDYITSVRSREFSPAAANPFDADGRHSFGSLTVSCYGAYGDRSNGNWEILCPGFVAAIVGILALK
jgi:lipid A 3-O-deacylase